MLAPRAGALRGHPLPRRRPLRLRLGDRLHLHRAGRSAERRLRHAPIAWRRRGHDPVLRAAAARPDAREGVPSRADVHVHRLREHRAARDQRRVSRARRRVGARPWTPDEHKDYALSTYNFHDDGSGIAYSSRLRPIITMRSGFLAYVDQWGSGARHLPADTHLVAWLDAMGHEVDIVTDEDLHAEGLALIAPYKVVMTPSHPEYQSRETLDALSAYVARGGRLMYLGGNGFYWRVALHRDVPGTVEIRRGEGGIRAWAAEPGEYYNAFDGAYGGLWRRNGRPPQQLVGVGFTSQAPFEGNWYRRVSGAADPRAAWILEGVKGDVIGNFGLSGGGAAGFELDRADHRLGTPANAIVVASSEGHDLSRFKLVHEDWLTDVRDVDGRAAREADPRGHDVLRDAERRRRVLGGLDHVLRQPAARRLRQRHLPHRGQRAAEVPRHLRSASGGHGRRRVT